MLSERDLETLRIGRRYQFLTARMVQRRTRPNDGDCADTRRGLRKLVGGGLFRKHQPKMVDPASGSSAAPIYAITTTGASVLVAETGDASYFLPADPSFVQWMSLWHRVGLSSIHMTIDEAFSGQEYAKLTALVFEDDIVDPDATNPSDRYKLHTTVVKGVKPVFFCPDSAIETDAKGQRRTWFFEYETGSDTPRRVFAKKHRGVVEFANGNFLRAMFPLSSSFKILCVCPNPAWRDALRKEFATHPREKSGAEHWCFCSIQDVTVAKFLHEPILYTADSGPNPFMKRPAEGPGGRPGEGAWASMPADAARRE